MKIAVIGVGYVGLSTAVGFAQLGHKVICIDQDQEKIDLLNQGKTTIYEPGLAELLSHPETFDNLHFETPLAERISDFDLIFIAVWTPTKYPSNEADLSAVYDVIEYYAPFVKEGAVFIVKSTVPVGTSCKLSHYISTLKINKPIYLASNPEFLREGSALDDFMNPDRILVGADAPEVFEKIRYIYQPFISKDVCYIETDIASAELIKYASNAFLATKVAFINEIADLCEKVGARIDQVSYGMGTDKRIGPYFLQPGPGYGGSCFPKDTRALLASAEQYQTSLNIVAATIATNQRRYKNMAQKVIDALDGAVKGKTIAALGIAFKANTNDIRESPALEIVKFLIEAGAILKVYDPKALADAEKVLPAGSTCKSIQEALNAADAAVILTEWAEFKNITPLEYQSLLKQPIIIDLRNIYTPMNMIKVGIKYISVGRN